MRRAESGGDASVRDLQLRLRRAGFAVDVDGVWGPQTASAWKRYATGLDRSDRQNVSGRNDYLRRALVRPQPQPDEEQTVLGHEGFRALQEARERLRAHINAIQSNRLTSRVEAGTPEPQSRFVSPASNYRVPVPGIPSRVPVGPHPRDVERQEREAYGDALLAQTGLEPLIRESARRAPSAEVSGAQLIGPSLYRKLGGDVEHPSIPENASTPLALLEGAALFGRPLRIVPAAYAGAKAAVVGKGVREASRTAYRESGPVVRAVKNRRMRTFMVGDRAVQIPAARSRTGRLLESIADTVMPEGARHRRAGRETRYSVEHTQRLRNADLRELKRVGRKLNDEQEYALRVLAEGIAPEERAARHVEYAAQGDELNAIYHGIHADLSERTAKYLDIGPGGRPKLRAGAPESLHRAWGLFEQAGETREMLLKELGRLSDAQIAARIHAPGRVYRGARWRTFEAETRRQLEAHPARQQYFAALDSLIPDEVQRNAQKALFDAAIRSAAERAGDPMAVKGILDRLTDVRTGETGPPPGSLLQPSWNEIPPEGTGPGGPKNLGDLEQHRAGMFDAGTVEWAFREYDDAALEEIATKYGLSPDELRSYAQQNGERLTGRILSNREVWKEGDPDYDVSRGVQATLGESGGHTWNADLTSFQGTSGFAVGVSADRGATFPVSDFNEAAVTAFRKLNGDVFDADPSLKVGSWRDGDTVYLDISAVVDNPKLALEIGRRENQLEVYDLSSGESLTLDQLSGRVRPPGGFVPMSGKNDPSGLFEVIPDDAQRLIRQQREEAWRKLAPPKPERTELRRLPDESDADFASRQAAAEQDYLMRRQEWDAKYAQAPDTIPEDWLGQRGGSLDIVSPWGAKGAIEFTGDQRAIIHLLDSADITTFSHELAHFIRRYAVSEKEARRIAKWAGATPQMVNGERRYSWSREAEETFARGIEQFIRTGQGPAGLKQAFRSLAPAFREVYEQADLPDVPPHVAKFFERLFQHERLRGGRLFGAEDVGVGVAYAPTWRGMPVKISEPHRAMGAYLRRTASLFGGGGRRAVGAGPDDIALRKSFSGSLLLSGFFRREVIGPKVESAILANRMAAVPEAHKAMLEAGSPIPRDVTDIAVKVDPRLETPDALKVFWDKIASVEGGQRKLGLRDLEDVNFDLIEAVRGDIFPAQLEGRASHEIAAEIIEAQTPIENVVWVPADYLNSTGLLRVPGSARAQRAGLSKTLRQGLDATGLTWDALNDFQKALILYLNPAYVPMQLVGNAGMNLVQQGVFMPVNLWRSVFLHREMSSLARVRIDEIMGVGAASALQLRTTPGQFIQATIGKVANLAADLVPRRAAFLHEARKAGYRKGADIEALLEAARRGEGDAPQVLEEITRLAKRAIVDFDRLSPFERNVVARWIFFYPWLRGATDWSIHFIADHPMQAMGLALAAEHIRVEQDRQLGNRPHYAQLDVPISTETFGLKVPGTDLSVGLDQAVGEHTWTEDGNPMVFNLRQAFTATTPFELAQSVIAFAGGGNKEAAADVVQSLTPVPYAAGVALYGYDPFIGREVDPGLERFFSEFGPVGMPLADRIRRINMSPEEREKFQERSIHPRERKHEWWRVFGGGLAPTPYNKGVGQRQALKDAPLLERRTFDLIEDSKDAGLGEPPRDVLEDLEWATRVDEAIERGDSWAERLEAVAGVYDERYPGRNMAGLAKSVRTEGEAKVLYEQLRPLLYPRYAEWDRQLDRIIDQRLEAEPVG